MKPDPRNHEQVCLYKTWLMERCKVEAVPGDIRPYRPHKGQVPVHYKEYRFGVVRAGQRAGKTLPLAFEHTAVLGLPRTRSWIVAPTYDLTDRAFEVVWKWVVEDRVFGPDSVNGARSHNTRDNRLITMKDGAFLRGKTAENPKSLVGDQLDFLGLDEARYFPEGLWGDKLRPRLVNRQGRALMISSPGGYGWFSDLWERGLTPEGQEDGWLAVAYTLYDNPFVERSEIEEMKRSMTDLQFRQEVLGEFVDATGRVWPQYVDALWPEGNLYDPETFDLPSRRSQWRALDIGYRNPTVCLWAYADREENVYVHQEYAESGVNHEDHAKNIVAQTLGDVFITLMPRDAKKESPLSRDASYRNVWDVYRKNGIICREATMDIQSGNDVVGRYFQAATEKNADHPMLLINRNCVETRKAILRHVYADPKARTDEDPPEKVKNKGKDIPDALRYLMLARPRYVAKDLRVPQQVTPIRQKRAWAGAPRIA